MRLLIVCLLISLQVIGQNKKDISQNRIYYNEQPKLTWNSFKGEKPSNTEFAASVNTGIGFKWSYATDQGIIDLQYEVVSYVQPNFSWVVEKEKDAELLTHEQLHFDITELHARMFRKRLSEYKFGRNIRKAMSKIHGDIEFERNQMQKTYDNETEHSKNTVKQLFWEEKIAKLLEKFKAYSK